MSARGGHSSAPRPSQVSHHPQAGGVMAAAFPSPPQTQPHTELGTLPLPLTSLEEGDPLQKPPEGHYLPAWGPAFDHMLLPESVTVEGTGTRP